MQGVAFGGDEDPVLGEQHLHLDVGVVDRQVHHGEVHGARRRLEHQGARRGVEHDHTHLGVLTPHRFEQWGHQPACCGADDAQSDGSHHHISQVGEIRRQRIELALDPSGPIEDNPSLVGGLGGGAVHEGHAQFVLEP